MPAGPRIIYDFDPHNLPDDLLRAIGLMVAASAQTENIVQQFIGALLGLDDAESLAVGLHMGGPLKSNVARTLIELNGVSHEIVDRVDELLDAIDAAAEKRNVIVHNNFLRNPETGEVLSSRMRARGSLKGDLKPVNVAEIEGAATEIYEAGLNLMGFMMAYGLEHRPRTRAVLPAIDRGKKARLRRREGNV